MERLKEQEMQNENEDSEGSTVDAPKRPLLELLKGEAFRRVSGQGIFHGH